MESSRVIPDGLTVDRLCAAASAETGLDDYGDNRFMEGLTRYVASLNRDANLTDIGRVMLSAEIHQSLVNRLRIENDVAKHPEILEERIAPPVIIVGMMRTGTTKLHKVLANDPTVFSLKFWQAINPAPFPGPPPDGPDPRITVAQEAARLTAQSCPELMAIHPPVPLEPDEEIYLLRLSYTSWCNAVMDFVPSYLEWFRDHTDYSYEYLHKALQYLQWQQGGGRGRHWVLKCPFHIGELDHVVETFPGAAIVHCHRDPCAVIASNCRLFEVLWQWRGSDVDPHLIGSHWLAIWSEQIRRSMELRDQLGDRLTIIDVSYDDVVHRMDELVPQIYSVCGQDLDPGTLQTMLDWEQAHPADRFGKSSYVLEDYGLSRDQVRAKFSAYLDRFGAFGLSR